MINFIKIEFGRIGADKNITPREVIRDFIEVLNIVCQNPDLKVSDLLGTEKFAFVKPELESGEVEKNFEEFEV